MDDAVHQGLLWQDSLTDLNKPCSDCSMSKTCLSLLVCAAGVCARKRASCVLEAWWCGTTLLPRRANCGGRTA